MISDEYYSQVELLLQVLPHVAKEEAFALKGGTAINLFVQNMPRLSVDIDLNYTRFEDRNTALQGIEDGLQKIGDRLAKTMPDLRITRRQLKTGQDVKLICELGRTLIKIEVNTVIRGHLLPTRQLTVTEKVEEIFGMFAAMDVVSSGELYGGKICAALDRQHPRDLFDVQQLYSSGGIDEEIRLGMIAALLGSPRPIHELLQPKLQDNRASFENQFIGMAYEPFDYLQYESTRKQLINDVNTLLTSSERDLLLSFESAEPNWTLYPFEELQNMPAVQWKLQNLLRLKSKDPEKHTQLIATLHSVLQS